MATDREPPVVDLLGIGGCGSLGGRIGTLGGRGSSLGGETGSLGGSSGSFGGNGGALADTVPVLCNPPAHWPRVRIVGEVTVCLSGGGGTGGGDGVPIGFIVGTGISSAGGAGGTEGGGGGGGGG